MGGNFLRKTQKMTVTAMMIAIGTLTSHTFFIPLGFVKVFPIQHFINVLSAVLLGPYYAVAQALSISILRNLMGTGSIFAFPGSIFGAFLAAKFFNKTRKIGMSVIGEVFGTGIIGAMATYPIATLLLGQEASLFGLMPAFIFSSIAGASIGYLLLKAFLKNTAVAKQINQMAMGKSNK